MRLGFKPLVLAIAMCLMLATASGRAGGAMLSSLGRASEQDTLQTKKPKPQLIIPDSLKALYRYTEGLKKYTIYKDTTSALKLYDEALAIDSTLTPAHYEKASMLLDSDPKQALRSARKAYMADSTNRWYMGLYGQALIINDHYAEATPIYRRLIHTDSKNPDNYRIMAMLYQQQQMPLSAIAIIDSAEMRLGKYPQLGLLKRRLYVITGQFDRAVDEAKQAVEETPYDQNLMVQLGETYAAAGRDSMAKITLKKAVEMDSTNIEALSSYIDYAMRKNDTRGYLTALRQLYAQRGFPLERKVDMLKRFMDDRRFYGEHYHLIGQLTSTLAIHYPKQKSVVDIYGEHLIAGGNLDGALEHFKAHLGDEPAEMDYYMAVIDIEDYRQHPDSVDRYVQLAVERFPDNPLLYIRKANRLYVKDNLMGAIETFHEAMQYATNDTLKGELWGYIGDTYHLIAERNQSIKERKIKADTLAYPIKMSPKKASKECYAAYEKSLALHYENASVLNNYAYYLSEENSNLVYALKMSTRAIELERNNSTYLDTYAWIQYKLGNYEEARKFMRQALSYDKTKSYALPEHYGDILFALGEYFMARTYWGKAIELGGDKASIEERIARAKAAEELQREQKAAPIAQKGAETAKKGADDNTKGSADSKKRAKKE